MENIEGNIELSDLPDDCIAEILKNFKTRDQRNDARLVCKVWHCLIDRDSSSERYLVNKKTTGYLDERTSPEFSDFIQQFLNFNRKKISFWFDYVSLGNTEHFWAEKGVDIIELTFENGCTRIPLERIFSECIRLRKMFIVYYANDIIHALESLAAKAFRNYSLHFLTITENYFEGMTVEIAILLVGLISKVFPRLRKVTLPNIKKIDDDNLEELSTKFIQLNCELELNSKQCTVVFDPSSKSPISVRKVTAYGEWILEPYDHYRNLEELTYMCVVYTFPLSELENLFSLYPALQTLNFRMCNYTNDLRKPVENRLKHLILGNAECGIFTADTVFFDTFKFLTIFHVCDVSYASFADIVENMRHLEDLNIKNSDEMDEDLVINDEPEVLVHTHLKKLTIPLFFILRTRTVYRFDKLAEITAKQEESSEIWTMQNVDKVLQRFQCPNLELIHFQVTMIPEAGDLLWLTNLMSMFPKLEQYKFYLYTDDTRKYPKPEAVYNTTGEYPKLKVLD